ncbi:septum formation family protein, partial [Streptomyces scabiei]
ALPRPAPGPPWHAPSDGPGGQDGWSPPERRSSGGTEPAPPPRTAGDRPGTGGRVRRHRLRALLAGLATALGLALVVAGAWQAVENLRDLRGALDGSADTLSTELPYGRAVGLVEPLRDGDCVDVTWAGTPFEDAARLRVVPACAGRAMDGQVMASYEASSAEDARTGGAARCERLTGEAREKLVDVRTFAVLPTADGFDAAGHRVACLLLGERRPVYGPIGAYRTVGETVLVDVATLQKQDCLDPISSNRIRLVSCHDRHRQKVLGFYEMSPSTTYDAAQDRALAACVRNMPPRQYGHEPGITASGFWISEDGWEKGAHFVVCTVISGSGGTMEGEEA